MAGGAQHLAISRCRSNDSRSSARPAEEMDIAADRPENGAAGAEGAILRIEHAPLQEPVGCARADISRSRTACAGRASPPSPSSTLGRPGSATRRRGDAAPRARQAWPAARPPCPARLVEALDQLVIAGRRVSNRVSMVAAADGHVAARLPDPSAWRPTFMTCPTGNRGSLLRDLLAPGGLLVGQDEQQIDWIGRDYRAAPTAMVLGAGGDRRSDRGCVAAENKTADDLILHQLSPAAAVQQHRLRRGASRDHFGLEHLRHGRAEHILADVRYAISVPVRLGHVPSCITPQPDIGRRERCHEGHSAPTGALARRFGQGCSRGAHTHVLVR